MIDIVNESHDRRYLLNRPSGDSRSNITAPTWRQYGNNIIRFIIHCTDSRRCFGDALAWLGVWLIDLNPQQRSRAVGRSRPRFEQSLWDLSDWSDFDWFKPNWNCSSYMVSSRLKFWNTFCILRGCLAHHSEGLDESVKKSKASPKSRTQIDQNHTSIKGILKDLNKRPKFSRHGRK